MLLKIGYDKGKEALMFGMLIGVAKRKSGLVEWLGDAQRVVFIAGAEAMRVGNGRIAAGHLWAGMLQVAEHNQPIGQYSLVGPIFNKLGVSLREKVHGKRDRIFCDKSAMVMRAKVRLGSEAKKVIQFAYNESFDLGHDYIGAGHLLLGLVGLNSESQRDAIEHPVFDLQSVRAAFVDCLNSSVGSLSS